MQLHQIFRFVLTACCLMFSSGAWAQIDDNLISEIQKEMARVQGMSPTNQAAALANFYTRQLRTDDETLERVARGDILLTCTFEGIYCATVSRKDFMEQAIVFAMSRGMPATSVPALIIGAMAEHKGKVEALRARRDTLFALREDALKKSREAVEPAKPSAPPAPAVDRVCCQWTTTKRCQNAPHQNACPGVAWTCLLGGSGPGYCKGCQGDGMCR